MTPKSDLASLGYVLIEMLAGRPCFEDAVVEGVAGGEANVASTLARSLAS